MLLFFEIWALTFIGGTSLGTAIVGLFVVAFSENQ